jgi:hypothetical protein
MRWKRHDSQWRELHRGILVVTLVKLMDIPREMFRSEPTQENFACVRSTIREGALLPFIR